MTRIAASLALVVSFAFAPLAFADQDKAGEGPRVEKSKDAEKSGDKATGAEMRDRRDEGKAIKDDYKESVRAGGERVKGKKPWWKFWGSEDPE